MQKIFVNLILDSKEKLLKEKNLLHILYRWREWRNGSEYKQFIDDIQKEDKSFLDFFDKFEYESRSQSSGEYGIKRNNKFHYNNLKEFFVFEDVKKRVELVIKKNNLLYKNHQSAIDLFLKYYDQRDKDIIDIS